MLAAPFLLFEQPATIFSATGACLCFRSIASLFLFGVPLRHSHFRSFFCTDRRLRTRRPYRKLRLLRPRPIPLCRMARSNTSGLTARPAQSVRKSRTSRISRSSPVTAPLRTLPSSFVLVAAIAASPTERRNADRRVAQSARHHRLRSYLPSHAALSLSRAHPRRLPLCALGAQPRSRIPCRSRSHRHVGIFSGRPSRRHGGHALRRRQPAGRRSHRSRQRPARLRHQLLWRPLAADRHRQARRHGESFRRPSLARGAQRSLARSARHAAHAAVIFSTPQRPISRFRCSAPWCSTQRSSKPAYPPKCTSFRPARTAPRSASRIPNSPSGPRCLKTGCASTAGSRRQRRRSRTDRECSAGL